MAISFVTAFGWKTIC